MPSPTKAPYPQSVPQRFELRDGKFGHYFYDSENKVDMALGDVLVTLNRAVLRKAQLTWMVDTYGDPSSSMPWRVRQSVLDRPGKAEDWD